MPVIGVMGPGENATEENIRSAYTAGKMIAKNGCYLLTGGRNKGVMHAATKGAKSADGIVIGILPDDNKAQLSEFVDIPIITGMGNARNSINILSSDLILVIGTGSGTFSEVALAMKTKKPIMILDPEKRFRMFLEHYAETNLTIIRTLEEFEQNLNNLFNLIWV